MKENEAMAPPRALSGVAWLLTTLIRVVAALLLIALMLHVVANAIGRQAANSPLDGTNEITTYWYLPCLVFLGIYLATAGGSHIDARLLFDRFPRRVQVETQVAGQMLMATLFAGFAVYSWWEALEAAELGLTAGQSDVPMWQVTFVIPVACALVVARVLLGIVLVLRTGDPEADRPGRRGKAEQVESDRAEVSDR